MKNENTGTDKAIALVEDGVITIRASGKATYEFLTKKYLRLLSTFSEARFIDRLNLFTHKTFRTEDEIESFWKSIDNKNKSTLLGLISKAMTATEDIQAFLLAKLFEKIQNDKMKLSYLDKVLFSNIELLVEEDFEVLYFYTKNNEKKYRTSPTTHLKIKIEDAGLFSEQIIKKLIVLGILTDESKQKTLATPNNIGSMNYPAKVKVKFQFSFTNYSFELMRYLEVYFEKIDVNIIEKYSVKEESYSQHL